MNVIISLRGKYVSKIICEECGYTHEREEMFSDIPLQIRGVQGVEESLSIFTTEEKLDGENKYFCEVCNKKVNAKKLTRIRQFPPVFTLGLNRFEIDFTTYDRKKVLNFVA